MPVKEIRNEILEKVAEYYRALQSEKPAYQNGDRLPYASRVYDEKEMCALVDSSLDFWLTSGRYAKRFEEEFADFLGVRYASLVNSGSSANLLAFMALTAPELEERAIRRGDEIITVAAAFPTTVTPIVQFGAVPVFVDVTIPQYNIDISGMKNALSSKTKAVMLAHTLGNPFDIAEVKKFCDEHRLWLIEDNCDALGSRYCMNEDYKYTGTFGDIATSSFYPPHHITMGEGGCVYTDNPLLDKLVRSFRDWGRDCQCPSGQDNLCNRRFKGQYGELPPGYDHKYVYSHFGYNLKLTDMQAAIGCEQLQKLPSFIETRKNNWKYLRDELDDLDKYLYLPEPCPDSDPSWFGFLLTCRENTDRTLIVQYLEEQNIQTRMLFSGNLFKHPCFDELRKAGDGYRVVGELSQTDRIMRDTFWVGVYPGLTQDMLKYMVAKIHEAVKISART